ncbi:putative zinc-binding metallopeptidase [uncultured Odoribacter sp.]|uniref:zinc-binding metallopeptidase n=1 Tax=uncultured Odoribacter sp. TaxID=876416 RepID=UPI0026352A1D|nr:putative zinc-binding metallopeptidase [uncultured Odoribacter sp.]
MKKIIIYLLALTLTGCLCSCDDDKPSGHSIFPTDGEEGSEFDQWLLYNYVYPYNIEVKYKMEDIESDMKYTLAPALPDKCVALSKVIKYLWLEAYDEVAGLTFTRTYTPRVIHMIGSGAYNTNNTVVLGTAEGGLKITLYKVNDIDPETVTAAQLNSDYLKTMHHEFAHILHQTKNYSTEYQNITGKDYIGDQWSSGSQTEALARAKGFISRYARYSADEDFVEMISIFVTRDQDAWEALLEASNTVADGNTETGKALLEQKFEIVKDYLKNSWNIDIYELRSVVQRRGNSLDQLDLTKI